MKHLPQTKYLMTFVATVKLAQKVHVVEVVGPVTVMTYIVSQFAVTAEEWNVKTVTSVRLQQMILIKLKILMIALLTIYLTIFFQPLTYLDM